MRFLKNTIYLFLFSMIFADLPFILTEIVQVYEKTILETNYSSLEIALNQNQNYEKTFLVSNSSYSTPCELFSKKIITNRSTIIGQNAPQIILLHDVIQIQNSLNLTNVVISSPFNLSGNMFKVLENGIFSCFKCVFTNIDGNGLFVFEANGGILFYDYCVFSDINIKNRQFFSMSVYLKFSLKKPNFSRFIWIFQVLPRFTIVIPQFLIVLF